MNDSPASDPTPSKEAPFWRRPFLSLMRAFIFTMGITKPTPKQERIATIYVTVLLLLVLFGTLCFGLLLAHTMNIH